MILYLGLSPLLFLQVYSIQTEMELVFIAKFQVKGFINTLYSDIIFLASQSRVLHLHIGLSNLEEKIINHFNMKKSDGKVSKLIEELFM